MNDLSEISDYELLGLSQDASIEEVLKRHKELTKTYHPDNNPGSNGYMQQLINNAKDRIVNNLQHGIVQQKQQSYSEPEQPNNPEPRATGFDYKRLLDDYIEFAYGKYSDSHAVCDYIRTYLTGQVNAITRDSKHPGQVGYRDLFKQYMTPEIVAQIVGKDIDGYVNDVVKYRKLLDEYIDMAFSYYNRMGIVSVALENYIGGVKDILVPSGNYPRLKNLADYMYAYCTPDIIASITGPDPSAYVTNRIMTLNQNDRALLDEFKRTYAFGGRQQLSYAINYFINHHNSPDRYKYFTQDCAAIYNVNKSVFINFVSRLLDVEYTLINETVGDKAAGVVESIMESRDYNSGRAR